MEYDNTETAKCPHCYGRINPKATTCRHCGKRINSGGTWFLGRLIIAAGVLSLLGVFFVDPLICLGVGLVLILIGGAIRGKE